MIGFRNLCTPASVYLAISLIAYSIMLFQNYGNNTVYCLGIQSCDTSNVTLIFILKFMYILFWTWILNIICRAGATPIAWILVILPFLLMFVMIGMFMIS